MTPREPLWTAQDAAEATQGRATGAWTASGVSIDSRTLVPGDLFVALKGPSFNGHDFIADALAKGAAAVMAEALPEGVPGDTPALIVPDTQRALEDLGRAGRARSTARIVAVTGSVGKTGTKDALLACFLPQGTSHASVGSFNNHWGVPLSLARLPQEAAYAVFEIGMNRPGEIAALTRMVRPQVAVITAVEAAHTAFFDSLEEIADAKAEIFQGVEPGGAAVLPRDNLYYGRLEEQARTAGIERILSFGQAPEATVRLLSSTLAPRDSQVAAEVEGQAYAFSLALPGMHWVSNALAVLAAVRAVGADVGAATRALAQLTPPPARGERHRPRLPGGPFEIIDDSYNANPSSVRAALSVLGNAETGQGGRRIAVLGDMRELGTRSQELHAALVEDVKAAGIDLVFTCGPEMAALHSALPEAIQGAHSDDSEALGALVAGDVCAGDVVLVKGSKAVKMGAVVQALRARDAAGGRSAANGS